MHLRGVIDKGALESLMATVDRLLLNRHYLRVGLQLLTILVQMQPHEVLLAHWGILHSRWT
jgi:hypothetical protein